MVGTGVFTSLGYQVLGLKSISAVLILWLVGGLIALCGALSYAELSVHYPGSGGEYNYLSRIYHPLLGFLSGWVSATVGFAAPIALSSMAFATYSKAWWGSSLDPSWIASGLIVLMALLNLGGIKISEQVQKGVTYFNILLMLGLIISGLIWADGAHFKLSLGSEDWGYVFSHDFAVSLIYVSFAYSGWNAVTYIAGDVQDAPRNVPRALYGSTLLVMLLYVLVNGVFLYALPIPSIDALDMSEKEKVAGLAAEAIFGPTGGAIISGLICLALLASVNSMTITGPKVTETLGKDLPGLAWLAIGNASGAPIVSIAWQTAVALLMVWTGSFKAVLLYIGFTLSLFTTLAVLGLLVTRWRVWRGILPASKGYLTPLFPLTPLIFIGLELWMLYFTLQKNPTESYFGLGTISVGVLIYFLVQRKREQ